MNTMNRIIFVYGFIAGATIIGSMILGIMAAKSGGNSFFASETIGYSIMLIGFSMIFVATKKYRDQESGGVINFRSAFKVGLGISLITGIVYVISWEVYLHFMDYAFINEYTDSIIKKAEESGTTEEQLSATIEQMEQMKEQYGNALYRLPITFIEVFPIGLLISLISAGLFRNPKFWASKELSTQPE